mmetsp:Transcript_15698/g.30130  ORF Transcript_15698/g.30130 Transcript_15698/m.30130 type:complete len:162 (-) Transcript_15698:292-777(-)|eukprot:CAMPEP_0114247962 /NCGR_PEP_ID=MMETSP0058-20121206/13308_1 /TAXON_ID=36894 /ORGANISM="Pyramimonas parkeae, CCMP726" /LENGTH=161 /DNA_ID=CAMNT_0001361315 /DNA_START=105 /DNA_END=590 /DNA_ORIENTATION=-
MSLSAHLRDDTGRKIRTVKVSKEENELRTRLKAFEARVNFEDPEQVAVLEEMREHTRRLDQQRGVWDKRGAPGGKGDWNEFKNHNETPKLLESYEDYKKHTQEGIQSLPDGQKTRKAIAAKAYISRTEPSKSVETEDKPTTISQSRLDFLKLRGLDEFEED